jgi:glycerol-3-phosphate O-acyltransferase
MSAGPDQEPTVESGPAPSAEAWGYDHPSAMRDRFGWFSERVGRRLFGECVLNEQLAERIAGLAGQGSLVYVLRHRSFADYFMVNFVLRRAGLPLAVYTNGVSTTWLGTIPSMLGRLLGRLRRRPEVSEHDLCAEAVRRQQPVLIFMRGRRGRSFTDILRNRPRTAPVGTDYLREILRVPAAGGEAKGEGAKVFVVPLGLFRGHSFRRRDTGMSALVTSVAEVPSDARKFLSYWWHHRNLFVTGSKEIDIGGFVDRYPGDLEERLVRRLTRTIQVYIHREERIVLGPALMPRRKIKRLVLDNDQVDAVVKQVARSRGIPEAKVRREADGYFEEMAAEFNGTAFAVIAWLFGKLYERMFQGMEPVGFDKVIETAKRHPIVLVPCHRSHFDYLILTYLFYLNFVSPPHIAAGINMRFWPMGYLFRSAGAFFIRRSFSDNDVYKVVFRQYLTFLIREGYTQEFFIEGGRSRTGKILTPKLGMLSAIVSAYCDGIRRDLYLVPVSIHYGRIVEEEAYEHELSGGEKEPESWRGLVKARRFLKQKFGTIYISFADPISLSDELGEAKKRFVQDEASGEAPDEAVESEKHRFIQKLGFRILKEVNEAAVAGATSVSATVLLGATHWGVRYEDFRKRANALGELVIRAGLTPTASLERNLGDFRESVEFLQGNGLIEVVQRGRDEILVVKQNKRMAMDFYKNNLIHAFLIPSLAGYCLLEGVERKDLVREIWWWLDLFRWEFALPDSDEVVGLVDDYLEYAEGTGALGPDGLDVDHPLTSATVNVLENFRESYYVAALTLAHAELEAGGLAEKALLAMITKEHEASVVVGEVNKPEGASNAIFRNALARYVEMGFLALEHRGRSGRDRWLVRGEKWEDLDPFVDRMAASLKMAVPNQPAQLRLARRVALRNKENVGS